MELKEETERNFEGLNLDKLIKEDKALEKYCSEKVRFLSFVHNKPKAGASTIAANSAVMFAQNNYYVTLIDADSRNPSENEITREIMCDKLAIVYDANKINPQRLDYNGVDYRDVRVFDSAERLNMHGDERIHTVLVPIKMFGKKQILFENMISQGMKLYLLMEQRHVAGGFKKTYSAFLKSKDNDEKVRFPEENSIEELISKIMPKIRKTKDLLETELNDFEENRFLFFKYFSRTIVPGLHVLPTEPNTLSEENSKDFMDRINIVYNGLKKTVGRLFIRYLDYEELVKRIDSEIEGVNPEERTPEERIRNNISEYIKEKIIEVEKEKKIKSRIMIADTGIDSKIALNIANISEPVMVVPAEGIDLEEIKDFILKLRYNSARLKKDIDEEMLHNIFEKDHSRLFDAISQFEKTEKERHKPIDFIEILDKLGYGRELRMALGKIDDEKHQGLRKNHSESGKSIIVSRDNYPIIDEEAKEVIENIKTIFNYGDKAENKVNIILNVLSEQENSLAQDRLLWTAAEELEKIKGYGAKLVGAVSYDEFVKKAGKKTLTPFTLLNFAHELYLNNEKEPTPGYGSRRKAAEDIRAAVENVVGR